ncbi:MAG: ABC-2 family transporter protein [Patescibacteria group bacterium]
MKRYVRIFLVLGQMAIKLFAQFRANTFGIVFSTSIWSFLVLSTIYLSTRQVKIVFGYTPGELLALGSVQVVFLGVFHTFVSKNMERMSEYVNQGFLDSLLLKPVDSQFMVSLSHHNYPAFFRIIIGVVALWMLSSRGDIAINGYAGILGFAFMLIFSIFLTYSIWFIFVTLLIWYPQMDNVVEFLYHLNTASRYPMNFYKEFGLFLVILFSPFAITLTVPLRVLTGKADMVEIFALIGTTVIFFIVARIFWGYALRNYTSASV